LAFVEFIVLLLAISLAAWGLSWGAEKLAECYGANFVGSILLALVTTLPEYMFVFFACLKDKYHVAIGSAIGACSMLMSLGLGLVILFSTSKLSKRRVAQVELTPATEVDAIYLMLTAGVAFALAWHGNGLTVLDGFILTALFAAYVIKHWQGVRKFQAERAANGEKAAGPGWKHWLAMGIAGLAVVVLSDPFVDSMIGVAKLLNIPAPVIALVLGPIASEMPEKLTAYVTVLRDGRLAEISVCNFIGSAVNHNSLLMALLPFIGYLAHGMPKVSGLLFLPEELSHRAGTTLNMSFAVMTIMAAIATIFVARRRLARWQGGVLVVGYGLVVYAAFATYGATAVLH